MVPVWVKKGFRKNYQICLLYGADSFQLYSILMWHVKYVQFSLQSLFCAAGFSAAFESRRTHRNTPDMKEIHTHTAHTAHSRFSIKDDPGIDPVSVGMM